jgi:GNAT superfamily N-acetyltransferase
LAPSSEIRKLGVAEIGLIAEIDRSEHVDVEYAVIDGVLAERPISMTDIPSWDPVGTGPYSVAAQMAFCEPLVRSGAVLLGAFNGDQTLGLAVVDASFEPPMAWLAFLYVGRPHRGRGVASALWNAAIDAATAAGATSMYVSAVPTGSAVGFYLSRGCRLADPAHPARYGAEPDDIHLIYRFQ